MQGELLLQDSFLVWEPKSLIRKGRERHLFLFELSLIFSKEIKDSSGRTKYLYKSRLRVPEVQIISKTPSKPFYQYNVNEPSVSVHVHVEAGVQTHRLMSVSVSSRPTRTNNADPKGWIRQSCSRVKPATFSDLCASAFLSVAVRLRSSASPSTSRATPASLLSGSDERRHPTTRPS